MDLASISQLARNQGPVFWVASAAIALGFTLLVVALIQHLRRVLGSRLAAPAESLDEETAPAVAAGPSGEVGIDVYRPAPSLAAAPPGREDAGDQSLALLLRRLQSTGDRLEEIAGDLRGREFDLTDSVLKEDLQDVEYVFRASGP